MPLDPTQLAALASLAGIEIAPEHMPGVIANLELLAQQAALLFEGDVTAAVEPAPVFRA